MSDNNQKQIDAIEKSIKKDIDTTKKEKTFDYHSALKHRGLSRYKIEDKSANNRIIRNMINIINIANKFAQKFVDKYITDPIGKQSIIGLVLASAIISFLSSFVWGSCSEHHLDEKVLKIMTDDSTQNKGDNFIINNRESTDGCHNFNGDFFRNSILFSAFILAFFRWQVGNKQSAMSEIFERKRSMNLYIINNESDIKDMISGAISDSLKKSTGGKKMLFKKDEAKNLLKEFLKINPHGNKDPGFKQRMFVYMELDNLEFALIKYTVGYLDAEQMFRACEIFESRCQSGFFRYLAISQGLAYYTEDLHELICTLMIFGYANSNDNNGSSS